MPAPDDVLPRLHSALDDAGYRHAAIVSALGPSVAGRRDLALHRRRLADAGRLGSLIALFTLGRPVEDRLAAEAFDLDGAERAGLVVRGPDGVRALVGIDEHAGAYVLGDPHTLDMAPDHVQCITPAARTLAALTPRRPCGSVLDLCCGSGLHALLATRHAGRVVATDLNPRATGYTRRNAVLNGVDVDVREGDLYEPVPGERFDLIVSNPPFVLGPEHRLIFRDARSEGLCRDVVRGAAEHLAPDGTAIVMVSWPHGDDWTETPRAWADGLGVHAWLLRSEWTAPVDYAAAWIIGADGPDAALDRWLAGLAERGITHISTGAIALRRTDGPPSFIASDVPPAAGTACGEHIARALDARALIGTMDALLACRPRPAADHLLEQTARIEAGELVGEPMVLRLTNGLRIEATLDAIALGVLTDLDGRRSVRDVIEARCRDPDADVETVRGGIVRMVRGLLDLGFCDLGG